MKRKYIDLDENPPHQDLKTARESFDLDFAKKLMAKLIRLIEFKEICPHYDCSVYIKFIDILEKGYNLNLYQIERIDNAYELLMNNDEISILNGIGTAEDMELETFACADE